MYIYLISGVEIRIRGLSAHLGSLSLSCFIDFEILLMDIGKNASTLLIF